MSDSGYFDIEIADTNVDIHNSKLVYPAMTFPIVARPVVQEIH